MNTEPFFSEIDLTPISFNDAVKISKKLEERKMKKNNTFKMTLTLEEARDLLIAMDTCKVVMMYATLSKEYIECHELTTVGDDEIHHRMRESDEELQGVLNFFRNKLSDEYRNAIAKNTTFKKEGK